MRCCSLLLLLLLLLWGRGVWVPGAIAGIVVALLIVFAIAVVIFASSRFVCNDQHH